MSFRSEFIQLSDAGAMRALAHRVRLDLLTHLLDVESATATECAEVIGESPSSCSYHLRVLARHGFIRDEETDDGREHRWRLVVRGFDIAADTLEQRAAGAALSDQLMRQDDEIINRFLREKEGFGDQWRDVAIFARSTLHLTPDEVRSLQDQYLALLEPYVNREIERRWPDIAERVRLILRAVPWSPGTSR